jgi:hypothetical protein
VIASQERILGQAQHRRQAGASTESTEGLQVLADDVMEHGVLGVSRPIHGLDTGHPCGYRARGGAPMSRVGYA